MRNYIEWIVRFRWAVVLIILGLTGFFIKNLGNLTVIIDPNTIVPQSHPFVSTTLKVEEVFGSRYVAVIGITPKEGDVFQPNVLSKVQRITQKLSETPRVVQTNLLSIAASRAKDIKGTAEGMQVQQMMEEVPTSPEDLAALKDALIRNDAYMNSVVSEDFKTLTILAEVRDASDEDKKEGRVGFTYVSDRINEAVDPERDDSVTIEVTGYPPFIALIEKFAERTPLLLMIAIIIIGIIHFEAFRTLQGLILPLVTPIIAVIWALGFMGLAKVPLDIFNTLTPILVLAVGAGHAVQLLKRYYEEYNIAQPGGAEYTKTKFFDASRILGKLSPIMLGIPVVWGLIQGYQTGELSDGVAAVLRVGSISLIPVWVFFLWATIRLIMYVFNPKSIVSDKNSIAANRQAVIDSIVKIGPVMLTAGLVASCGFFSLMVFDIVSIRVFGVFSGVGILSILIVEMTLIPALRAILPPPSQGETDLEKEERIWDKITGFYANTILGTNRKHIFSIAAVLVVVSVYGASKLSIESSLKGYFSPDLELMKSDSSLNERMAGTNNIYLMFDGGEQDAIKDPEVLKAMDKLAQFIETEPHVGKVLSIAQFIKQMNKSMNADDPEFYRIPDNRNTIAEYLLIYSMSGSPGDFDPYVDYDYQLANMVIFTHSDNTTDMLNLWANIQAFVDENFPPSITVNVGGSVAQSAALAEVIVKDKLLNIAQIAGVVFLFASIIFRSPVAGLLVITPLLLAVLTNMGLMGILGLSLNIPTALVSSLAIGIGADYAIYMLFRLREELGKGTEVDEAFRKVLRTAGKACLFVASAVAGGYAVQAFSRGYYPHTWTAILIATAMIVSVTAALTIMPALILKFRPKFIFDGVKK
jgi:predicted RND superfamily exporter protein